MRYFPLLLLSAAVAMLCQCNGQAQPSEADTEKDVTLGEPTTSPIVHDPVVVREDSMYYLFCTGMGITCFESKDMEQWQMLAPCLDTLPQTIKEMMPGAKMHLWAPDVIYHNGLWHMFYSVSAFGKNTSVIGHCTTPTLDPRSEQHKWTDCGPVVQSVPHRDDWNAIDPNIVIADGDTAWMTFGSFWNGIQLFRLTPDMNAIAQPAEWYNIASRRTEAKPISTEAGDNAIEAPFIFRHGGFYYLLASFDYCCRGSESTYRIMVGRADNVRGPYLDRDGNDMAVGGGTELLKGDKTRWNALGHCSAYTFDDADYLFCHAYDAETGAPHLLSLPISWDNEWPVVSLPE